MGVQISIILWLDSHVFCLINMFSFAGQGDFQIWKLQYLAGLAAGEQRLAAASSKAPPRIVPFPPRPPPPQVLLPAGSVLEMLAEAQRVIGQEAATVQELKEAQAEQRQAFEAQQALVELGANVQMQEFERWQAEKAEEKAEEAAAARKKALEAAETNAAEVQA